MSVQILLQGRILGTEAFLLSGSGDELDFAGRAQWLSLLSEVLPRAILAELGLAKILLGSSGGEQFLIGSRLKPFGFEWLPHGKEPYEEILTRVNRIAYRAFTQNPELPFDDFKQLLGKAMFGDSAAPQTAEDLLFLQESFFMNRSWFSASPLVSPSRAERA